MQFALLVSLGLMFSLPSFSQHALQTIKVSNLKNLRGDLYIGWYNTSEAFKINEKAVYRDKIVVNNQSEVVVRFHHIPTGKYAIAVFLDENDNYHLDRNFFGIPKEKYGFSNNKLPRLRSATFKESSFELGEGDAEIHITLK
jgi:uncharacterized protein (DUF2141 family)